MPLKNVDHNMTVTEKATARSVSPFEQLSTAYFLVDTRGQIRQANTAAASLLGRSREGLVGKLLEQFLTPASQGTWQLRLRQAKERGQAQRVELSLTRGQGGAMEFLADLSPAFEAGALTAWHLLLTDITEYKQAQTLLMTKQQQHEQELQNYSVRVQVLNSELQHLLVATQQQLHLLLARATNLLQVSQQPSSPQNITEHLQALEGVVQQVYGLLGSLERYRQMRTMRVRVHPVPLQSVLKSVLRDLAPVMADRQVRVSHDPLPVLQGDSQALGIILKEYLNNALKFSRERSETNIHIKVRETDTEYYVGVEDNGVGFNMRQKEQLFRMFSKLHSAKQYEGTGAGLMTVQRACERFGGRVWAEGKVGQGATFWFAWPKVPRLQS